MRISEHLTTEETQCHGRTCGCNHGASPDDIHPGLVDTFETVRFLLNVELGHRAAQDIPIIWTCGARCPIHNAEVGGVPNSQHLISNDGYFRAGDMYQTAIANGLFYDKIRRWAKQGKLPYLRGLGYYPKHGFCHLDVRPGTRLITWKG